MAFIEITERDYQMMLFQLSNSALARLHVKARSNYEKQKIEKEMIVRRRERRFYVGAKPQEQYDKENDDLLLANPKGCDEFVRFDEEDRCLIIAIRNKSNEIYGLYRIFVTERGKHDHRRALAEDLEWLRG